MGVWSGRTRGTKITESSWESLSMNMKPRLNIQLAAACWCVVHCFLTISKLEPLSDSTWLRAARQEGRGSWEACDWRSYGKASGEFWEGGLTEAFDLTLPSGGRDRFRCEPWVLPAPGSEEDNRSWALTSVCLPHPVLLGDGRKSLSHIIIQEKTPTKNLPSVVGMRQFLYLAERVLMALPSKSSLSRSYRRDSAGQGNLCHCDQIWPDTPLTLLLHIAPALGQLNAPRQWTNLYK